MLSNSLRSVLFFFLFGVLLLGCTTGEGPDKPAHEPVPPQESLDAADRPDETLVPADQPADQAADQPADQPTAEAADQPAAEASDPGDDVASAVALLADPSAEVRARAAQSLGALGEAAKPAAAELTALLNDDDPAVRRQAVGALAAIQPEPEVMIPLFTKLLEDSDPGVQLRVLQALADAGEAAVPGLIKALDADETEYWACVVLRDIGPAAKDAVPALTEKLNDPREEIQIQAILALGAMGEAALSAVPQIAAALGNEHVAPVATFALGQLGSIPGDAEPVIRSNAQSGHPGLRTVSLWTLARVHLDDLEVRRAAMTELIARLKDERPQIRAVAARGLAALPPAPEVAVPLWEEAMKDADATIVLHALDAIASLGAPAVPRLASLLDTHEQLRVEVTYILGQMGPEAAAATEALAGLLADEDVHLATEAALALGKIGPAAKSAVPALCAVLEHDDEKNSHSLILALGKIGPDAAEALPLVLKAMESEDKALAVLAAWTLVRIQPASSKEPAAKAVPVLIAGLEDPLPETRKTAAETLGSLGALAREAVPALEKAKEDDVEAVREAAAEALEAID